MHLDTVFTVCSEDVVNVYEPVVRAMDTFSLRPDETERGGIKVTYDEGYFVDVVSEALGVKLTPVMSTAGRYGAECEQWNDGNNVVALSPGVVVAYDRNYSINANLRAAGDPLQRARARPRRRSLHDLPDRSGSGLLTELASGQGRCSHDGDVVAASEDSL